MIRTVLITALISGALLAGCGGEPPSGPGGSPGDDDRRPDVVLVVLDTLRADVLSFYGAAEERAPFLARLAEEGTVFEKAFSTSTWTAPATASVLTGTYPDRHGVVDPRYAMGEVSSFVEKVHAKGYQTVGFTDGGYVRGFEYLRRLGCRRREDPILYAFEKVKSSQSR